MIIGVILAGGKGSRFKAGETNKTAVLFNNKPLIQYGIEAYQGVANELCIVVGAHKDSVIAATRGNNAHYIEQRKRLGTGHAIKLVVDYFKKKQLHPSVVLVGYGDHMTFYTQDIIRKIVKSHVLNKFDITLITTSQKNPTGLGRIVRSNQDKIVKIVEEKDASSAEREITEINAGFYCFNYDFLEKNYKKLTKSPVTGEYYITELITIAISQGKKVKGYKVPFKHVGYGINTREDFSNGLLLYNSR
ncbi:MAG TPA: sugar phosphate nucleotidyltransferase [Patescibacteria group bacterium]|nr:sugar phosphate nucleotidyltransferase [Patescibacteria group bacterium]